ncbi:Response regulatory domain-containing protein [Plasmodiophora brassicae]|uniref:Response regulatory domain-containing protein n=1 Tax=Plasmodiophora brassicae TaxID=37360 RepID=A0A0G4J958_PLABS|nr:hypothetical protein PBRA_009566 [Plasmodiophora brassicae]SPQ98395.1 unnamed protein product [Plasmodiophora brassicae]
MMVGNVRTLIQSLFRSMSVAEPASRLDGLHVLYADDSPILRKMVKRRLVDAGAIVYDYEDGEQAVRAFDELAHVFDIVLLDLDMPKLDGLGAASAIRQRHPTVPIIAVSGENILLVQGAVVQAGMNAFVSKRPECISQLVSVIINLTCRSLWKPESSWQDKQPIIVA